MSSEFRRLRLVSRLFDCFSICLPPSTYAFQLEQERSILSTQPHDWSFLMARTVDAQRLQRIADEMRQDEQEEELNRALALVQRILLTPSNSIDVSHPGAHSGSSTGIAARLHNTQAADSSQNSISSVAASLSQFTPISGSHNSHSNVTLSIDGLTIESFRFTGKTPTSQLSRAQQESQLVDDIIGVLLGHPGRFVYLKSNILPYQEDLFDYNEDDLIAGSFNESGFLDESIFCIDEDLDRTLGHAIIPALRTATEYVKLARFAAFKRRAEDGRICQALAAAIHHTLGKFRNLLVLLEQNISQNGPAFGIQQLLFHVAPHHSGLSALGEIISEIVSHRLLGGAILVSIEKAIDSYSGDRPVKSILEDVLLSSAAPFLEMLRLWLESGRLDDPHGEFMLRPRNVRDPSPLGSEAHSVASAFVLVDVNAPAVVSGLLPRIVSVGAYHSVLSGFSNGTPSFSDQPSADMCQSSAMAIESSSPDVNDDDNFSYDRESISLAVDRAYAAVNHRMLGALFKALSSYAREPFSLRMLTFCMHSWTHLVLSLQGQWLRLCTSGSRRHGRQPLDHVLRWPVMSPVWFWIA
jgi:hypothetical protein